MKNLYQLIASVCVGMLFLPGLFAQTQEAKPKRPVDLIMEAEKQLRMPGKIEDRRRAAEDLLLVSERMSNAISTLSTHGLNDPDDEVRSKAAKALARLGPTILKWGDTPLDAAIRLLEKDKLPEIRCDAVNILANVFWDGSNPRYAKAGISALIRAMRHDKDTLVRRNACAAFRVIGPLAKDAAPDLLEVIKDKEDGFMRELACTSLGSVVCPECKQIVPGLLEIYQKEDDDSWNVKGTVLGALGKIGEKKEIVIPLMIAALQDPKKIQFRGGAAYGLGEFGPKAKTAVPALIAALDVSAFSEISDPGKAQAVRGAVLNALGAIGPDAKAAVPAIRKIAEMDEGNRFGAERALMAIEQK